MSEGSSYEDEEVATKPDFNETTVRLVTEFLFKTNVSPADFVNLDSFKDLLQHLNPAAQKPTEYHILDYISRNKYPHEETRCIVCGNHGEDKETKVLGVEDAAMILATLLAGTGKKETEAERNILSASLRACSYHLPFICSALMTFLQIDDSLDFDSVPMHKMAEACMWYKSMMTCRFGKEAGNVLIPEFKNAVTEFLDTYYEANAVTNQESLVEPTCSNHEEEVEVKQESNSTPTTKRVVKMPQILTLPNGKKVIRVSMLPNKMTNVAGKQKIVKYRIAKRPEPSEDNGGTGTSAVEEIESKVAKLE